MGKIMYSKNNTTLLKKIGGVELEPFGPEGGI